MIIDHIKIYVKAGDGGEGDLSSLMLSARRVVGGGGDGGDGGNVFIKVSPHLYDLNKFLVNKKFIAKDGQRGSRNNKKGKRGEDITVNVPQGTVILDTEGNCIADLAEPTGELLICRGGAAGKGTYKKTYNIPAQAGEERELILDYRIPNDVAVVGMPNSGKTSLVNALTGQSFKVAQYPFTTIACAWAKATVDYRSFTVLDTPPLNEKTHEKGLDRFLKHLTRSSILLLISANGNACAEEFDFLKREISAFDEGLLADKKIFYLLNKIDTIETAAASRNLIRVSAANGQGIDALKKKLAKALETRATDA